MSGTAECTAVSGRTQSFGDHGLCRSGSCYPSDLTAFSSYGAACLLLPKCSHGLRPQGLHPCPSLYLDQPSGIRMASSFNPVQIDLTQPQLTPLFPCSVYSSHNGLHSLLQSPISKPWHIMSCLLEQSLPTSNSLPLPRPQLLHSH